MTFQTKRQLREKITQLKAELQEAYNQQEAGADRVRDTIRVLNLTEYISKREDAWGDGHHTHYDVNQFLEDIEVGVKELDKHAAGREEHAALERLGLNDRLLTAARQGRVIA